MRTHNNLYPQIIHFTNLYHAWKNARRGKRYTSASATFGQNLDEELITLQRELTGEAYQPGAYRTFTLDEPKRRKISAAPFRDRVVHHALCNIIVPIYERKFIYHSYANRVGKGTHAALDRCTEWMRQYRYVLPCDVQQFFPAIDHQILKDILRKTIACQPTINLCEKIIDSGRGILDDVYTLHYFPTDDLFTVLRPRGLPIGNLTSQFWANVYLNELDYFVKRHLKCKAYVRYVDDFLLFANSPDVLHRWRLELIQFLQQLRLTLHELRSQPRPVQTGITFLGFYVFPTHRRIQREKGIRYRRHLYRLIQDYRCGEIQRTRIDESVRAWVGHAMHGDTWGLRASLFGGIIL